METFTGGAISPWVAGEGFKGRVHLRPWGHLEEVTLVTMTKSHHPAILCLKVETSQAEGGLVTETSLGPSLHVSIFWFLVAKKAGVTYLHHQELFALTALVNEDRSRLRFGGKACTNLLSFQENTGWKQMNNKKRLWEMYLSDFLGFAYMYIYT